MLNVDSDYEDRLYLPDAYEREEALRPPSPKDFHDPFTETDITAICTSLGTLLRHTQSAMALLPLGFVAREADDFDGIRVRFDSAAFRVFLGCTDEPPRTVAQVCTDWLPLIRSMLLQGFLPLGFVASDAHRIIRVHPVEYFLTKAMVTEHQFEAAVATALKELIAAHPEAAHLRPDHDPDSFRSLH
jgi:hypothetical protein